MQIKMMAAKVVALFTIVCILQSDAQCQKECTCNSNNYVHCTGLSSFPTNIPNSTETLTIDLNIIYTVPTDSVKNLPKLKDLAMERCNITSIKPFAFRGAKGYNSISLMANKITKLTKNSLSSMDGISYLNIKHNKIKVIESYAFNGTKGINNLELSNNPIERIKIHAFDGLENVNNLDLTRSSELTSLGSHIFHGMTQVKQIAFSYSEKLQYIEKDAFHGIEKIDILELSHCSIQYIEPGAFNGLKEVGMVKLNDNKIQTLQRNSLDGIQNATIDFSENPLICDCNLKWLIKSNLKKATKSTMKCAFPSHLKGRVISNITEEEFQCYPCVDLPTNITVHIPNEMPKTSYTLDCIEPNTMTTMVPTSSAGKAYFSVTLLLNIIVYQLL